MQTSTHTRLDYSTHLVNCFRKEITVYLLMNYTEEKASNTQYKIPGLVTLLTDEFH